MPPPSDHPRLGPVSVALAVAFVVAAGVPAATAAAAPTPSPTASPAPLTQLWSGQQPDSSVKTEPYWPAVDPATGDIWVSSPFTDQFWIFGMDGTFKEAWGTPGHGDGQFQLRTNDPHPDAGAAIAFLADGSFYLTDVGNYRVQHYDADRMLVGTWGSFGTDQGQFTNPKGIATDGTKVFVADDSGTMQAFGLDGTYERTSDLPFVLFSMTPGGTLLTSDETGIAEYDQNGTRIRHLDLTVDGSMLTQPIEDAAGDLWVGTQNDDAATGLLELAPDGTVLGRWSTGFETAALAPDGSAIYETWTAGSNHGWPDLRAYALPTP